MEKGPCDTFTIKEVRAGMAMYGYVWLCRAMYGCVWLCMAVYGYVGLCMAM